VNKTTETIQRGQPTVQPEGRLRGWNGRGGLDRPTPDKLSGPIWMCFLLRHGIAAPLELAVAGRNTVQQTSRSRRKEEEYKTS